MKVRLRNIDECDEFYRRLMGNVDLSHDTIYEVIEIQQSSYRLEGDRKEPALYDKRMFDIVDPTIPEGYIYQFCYEDSEEFHEDEDGFIWRDFEEEYNITPKCFAQRAFFDFYFDRHEEQVAIYNEYIKNRNKSA